jgi:hypothetical protein
MKNSQAKISMLSGHGVDFRHKSLPLVVAMQQVVYHSDKGGKHLVKLGASPSNNGRGNLQLNYAAQPLYQNLYKGLMSSLENAMVD